MPDTLSNSAVEHLKIEVAACTRLLNNEEILGYSGHVSVRLPDRETLLIQSFDSSRNDLTPEELFIVDLDGNVLDGPSDGRPVNEVEIHSEVLRARDDVNAVLHYHPEIATLFTMTEGIELKPMKKSCLPVGKRHPDTPGIMAHRHQGARPGDDPDTGRAQCGDAPVAWRCHRVGKYPRPDGRCGAFPMKMREQCMIPRKSVNPYRCRRKKPPNSRLILSGTNTP